MKRAVKVALGLLILLTLGGVGARRLCFRRPKINTGDEVFAKLELGMTEPEIAAIIGGPAGNYSSQKNPIVLYSIDGPSSEGVERAAAKRYSKEWIADADAVCVSFDEQGRADAIRWGVPLPPDETWFEQIISWLRSLF